MKGVMSVALLTAVSCSQTETDIFPAGGGDAGTTTALGVTASVNGGAGTKAVVDYNKILYPGDNYADAPGLGVVLTNKNANGWYDASLSNYGKNHIWFMGDITGANWISIDGKGTNYGDNKKDYNLSTEVGRVYAYYPYDGAINTLPAANATSFTEADLKIPVSVKTTGTIDATISNADKVWDVPSTSWKNKTITTHIIGLADPAEKDYMYYDGFAADGTTQTGRYVNNGHAGNQPSANDNKDTDNPGSTITLTMKHALAMVSFRVYDAGNLGEAGKVELVEFKIADNTAGTFLNTANGTMALSDGAITSTTTLGNITRTVTNYTLVQQIPSGTETVNTFIENTTTGVTGKAVSKIVSALVYPVDFSAGNLKLSVKLKDSSTALGTPVETVYDVNLPGRNWERNKHYIYTLSAGRNKLDIVSVEVKTWDVVDSGELPL